MNKKKLNILERLRSKKTKPLSAVDNITTIPLSDHLADMAAKGPRIEPQQLVYGCAQSVGKQREHNEDSIFTFTTVAGGDSGNPPLGLFVVADGMGGHQYGEVASAVAIRTLASYILKKFLPYVVNPSESPDEPLQELMRSAINEAQRAVTQAAPGSGTTLTAALVLGGQITFGHVGDSRAYAIHPYGSGDILTRDHSLVKRLEELGQISSNEAATHPQRNVLYRALGQGEVLEPDIFTIPFPQSGYILICSDGLWSVIPDSNIYEIVLKGTTLQTVCQNLVAAANDAGGPDNISVVVAQLMG